MSIPAEETERRVAAISAGMQDAGLRLTHQRLEIVREIVSAETHPDVETVYRGVRKRMPTVSLDTVYRTLSVLTEHGLIEQVTATVGPARYDGNPLPHHHFVCTSCGLVRDIHDTDTGAIPSTKQTNDIGNVESVQVQYRGVCATCQ